MLINEEGDAEFNAATLCDSTLRTTVTREYRHEDALVQIVQIVQECNPGSDSFDCIIMSVQDLRNVLTYLEGN